MTSLRYNNPPIILGLAFSLCAVSASAQVPPPETNALTLVDVGPVSVAAACPCITNPFTVPTIRPGWGYPSGPAAPLGNAVPSAAARRLQAQRDAEDRAELATNAADGLAGNPHASAWIAMHSRGEPRSRGTMRKRRDGYIWPRRRGIATRICSSGIAIIADWASGETTKQPPIGFTPVRQPGTATPWSLSVSVRRWTRRPAGLVRGGGVVAAGQIFSRRDSACVAIPRRCLCMRTGHRESYEEAVLAYKEWVDKGDMSSSVQLGHMYAADALLQRAAAVAAYRVAADQGDPEAQVSLSGLVREGRGVKQDAFEAYFWARLAERRLPPGKLRERAEAQAKLVARLMSAAHVKDTDAFVDSVIVEGAKTMR